MAILNDKEIPEATLPFIDAFSKNKFIKWKGQVIQRGVRFPVTDLTLFRITMVSSKAAIDQALIMSGKGCKLNSGGQQAKMFRFWYHKSPKQFSIVIEKASEDAEAVFWNEYGSNGRSLSTTGNAGIIVQELSSQHLRLSCSDGDGDFPNFSHLVVEIEMLPPDHPNNKARQYLGSVEKHSKPFEPDKS